jgi:pantetheine-phosphate adenylyltransferase
LRKNKKIAIYPGTFDPITNGHLDIIHRASILFDEVIVAVAVNRNKTPLFSIEERVELIKETTKSIKNVAVDTFSGLIVEYCQMKNAIALIRGLRAVSDFEIELQMALVNRKIGKNVETVFLMPSENNTYLSSSVIREIASFQGDVTPFVPDYVKLKLDERLRR